MKPTGLYIHIPFCRSKCPYCDFYSLPFAEEEADRYTHSVCRALACLPVDRPAVDTVYFGGGTPGLLGAERIARLLEAVAAHTRLSPGPEITLEANPGSLPPSELPALRRAGVSRISFGVQSLRPRELEALGRAHTAEQATDSLRGAAEAGFEHISADLMLGIPGQTRESLHHTLEALVRLPADHISAYLLKIEAGTPFGERQDLLPLPGEEETADLYLDCVSFLEAHGFPQYEISNFAGDENRSRHNLKYWRCEPYIGIGPAAHSFLGGRRFYFPRSLDAFLEAERPFTLTESDGEGGGFEEYAMLRLRLREGLDLAGAEQRYSRDCGAIRRRAIPLQKQGLLELREDTISLTPQGFLLSNAVTGALLL